MLGGEITKETKIEKNCGTCKWSVPMWPDIKDSTQIDCNHPIPTVWSVEWTDGDASDGTGCECWKKKGKK